jgi:hypothetical protein
MIQLNHADHSASTGAFGNKHGHGSLATAGRYVSARPEKSSGDYLAVRPQGRKRIRIVSTLRQGLAAGLVGNLYNERHVVGDQLR